MEKKTRAPANNVVSCSMKMILSPLWLIDFASRLIRSAVGLSAASSRLSPIGYNAIKLFWLSQAATQTPRLYNVLKRSDAMICRYTRYTQLFAASFATLRCCFTNTGTNCNSSKTFLWKKYRQLSAIYEFLPFLPFYGI